MSLNDTPRANRLHIAVFGRTNSGKSSLINAVTNQQISIVSHIEGTTTDPVYKTMELNPIGPVVWIDTAGFDDTGSLGKMRVEKTNEVTDKTDIALILFTSLDFEFERRWIELFKKKKTPVIAVINKIDEISNIEDIKEKIQREFSLKAVCVSAKEKKGIDKLRDALTYMIPEDFEAKSITRDMCREGDLVLLVMPQDIQAPKGRLILPQVQTLRELLDKKCSVMSVTTDKLDDAFKYMSYPPKLIITDSQVFDKVYEKKPKESALTSFSVLFAGYKGDIQEFIDGAKAISELSDSSRVLIAEACTHAPMSEDIGREKIPKMLRQRYGANMRIDILSGPEFPEDLTCYDLIIHCGACMFNRKYVLSRIRRAKEQNVRITNYGVAIAYLKGILDKIDY